MVADAQQAALRGTRGALLAQHGGDRRADALVAGVSPQGPASCRGVLVTVPLSRSEGLLLFLQAVPGREVMGGRRGQGQAHRARSLASTGLRAWGQVGSAGRAGLLLAVLVVRRRTT